MQIPRSARDDNEGMSSGRDDEPAVRLVAVHLELRFPLRRRVRPSQTFSLTSATLYLSFRAKMLIRSANKHRREGPALKRKTYYVYIMASRSLNLYTGITNSIYRRA